MASGEGDYADKPYILGINASPNDDEQSAKNLADVLRIIEKLGGRTKRIDLVKLNIKPCDGAYSKDPKRCNIEVCVSRKSRYRDEMHLVVEELLKADGFIVSAPVQWFSPGSHAQHLIERFTALENSGFLLEGKVAGFIASAAHEGSSMALAHLLFVFNQMGVIAPPYGVMSNKTLRGIYERNVSILDENGAARAQLHEFRLSAGLQGLAKNMLHMISLTKRDSEGWA